MEARENFSATPYHTGAGLLGRDTLTSEAGGRLWSTTFVGRGTSQNFNASPMSRTAKLNHREPMSNEITKDAIERLDSSALFALGRSVDDALRNRICRQWHYSDYGDYETFEDMPKDMQDACIQAAHNVLILYANAKDQRP